jgi:hypothetical protein
VLGLRGSTTLFSFTVKSEDGLHVVSYTIVFQLGLNNVATWNCSIYAPGMSAAVQLNSSVSLWQGNVSLLYTTQNQRATITFASATFASFYPAGVGLPLGGALAASNTIVTLPLKGRNTSISYGFTAVSGQ